MEISKKNLHQQEINLVRSAPPVPKTAKQLAAKRNKKRVKSILLLAIPNEYLLKFHNVPDAKSLWEAIKSRFRGNEESKKMQKNVLKHQFENFSTASNKSLDKAYDRFQKLISKLEVHRAPILKEDINQKFLRSLPLSWNQIALIMRNKPDIDEIDIDDLYNNLRVYEDEMKRSSSSTSTSQNLAFLSSKNTSSTNEVSTANGDFGVSTAGGMSQVSSTICAHDVASGRNQGKRSYDDTGRSNAPTNKSSTQALVAQDGLGGYDWSNDFEVEPINYALMISLSVFDVRSSDEENTLANDSLSKVDGFHIVPPSITGNFLTPRADISFAGLDEYAIRKKIIESKTTDLNTKTSEPVDHNLWDIIVNGDLQEESTPTEDQSGPSAPLVPKTTKQLAAKRNQERMLNHSRKQSIQGNEESKKMQKNNLAFLSSENTASGDFGVSTAGGISQVSSTPCAQDVACSFFAQPTTSPQLKNEDFQQIDEDDLEELDFRWQMAMLTIKSYNCHRKGHFARECRSRRNQRKRSYGDTGKSNAPTNESSSQALVDQDGLGGYDWRNDFEVEPVNYALMAISSSSSSSSSNNEVQKCSKQCLESFKTLQKNYDSKREKHSRARLEIQGYELALESLESRILVHEKNELAWGEKYDQMSARDKTGLGYGIQLNEMSNNSKIGSKISLSVFYVRSSDEENTPANDRFSKVDGFHAVPPPITGNVRIT
ncbi:ribonuclease H-like domain-containing protein [Tanacetum coccineum]